jgi:hypothetical protein
MSKTNLQTKPDAIIITMPASFFQEYTMEKFVYDMDQMNIVDGYVWYMVKKNLPKIITQYCYILYDGKIQYRTEIAQMVHNQTLRFTRPGGTIKTFPNANYIELIGPTVKAPYDIPMKGFRGFRYSPLIY